MHLETKRLIIRDLEPKDAERLLRVIWQADVVRFMKDWSEHNRTIDDVTGYIRWRQTQRDATDVYAGRRYAIALKDSDAFIGIVGMGLEDTLNEVELAYFMDTAHQGQGYVVEALTALFDWCMTVSRLPYLILTIDCANEASCRVADKAGFQCFEKRTPIGHRQPNMESDSYYYYRRYRA